MTPGRRGRTRNRQLPQFRNFFKLGLYKSEKCAIIAKHAAKGSDSKASKAPHTNKDGGVAQLGAH